MIRAQHVALVALGLAMIGFGLAPACASAAPDQRRRTTFQQQDGVTCTPVPGVGLRCSDGRVSTTVRASAVPCGDGYAASNVACVEDGRLQAWGANQTLIADGNRLDAWSGAATAEAIPGASAWRVTGSSASMFINKTAPGSLGDTITVAGIVRRGTATGSQLFAMAGAVGGGSGCTFTAADAWTTYSCTATSTAAGNYGPLFYPGRGTLGYTDAVGFWSVKGSTPGRPCWFENGTAGTCAADVHTISTSGWPTTEGWLEAVFDYNPNGSTNANAIVDGRTSGGAGTLLFVTSNVLRLLVDGTTINGPTVSPGTRYRVRIERRGGISTVRLDGAIVGSAPTAAWAWKATSTLGSNFQAAGADNLAGSLVLRGWSAK